MLQLQQLTLVLLQPADLRAQRLLPWTSRREVSTGQLRRCHGGAVGFDDVTVVSGVRGVIALVRLQECSEACVWEEVGRKITVAWWYKTSHRQQHSESSAVSTSRRVRRKGGAEGSIVKPQRKKLMKINEQRPASRFVYFWLKARWECGVDASCVAITK